MLLVRPALGGFNDNSRNDISLRNEKCHFSSYSPAGCARNYFSVGEMKKHSRTIFRSKLLTSCHLTHYIWNTKCVSTTGRCIFVTNKFECTFRKRMKKWIGSPPNSEARSRLYRRRLLHANSKYSLDSSWPDLQDLHTVSPLRPWTFSKNSSTLFPTKYFKNAGSKRYFSH